MKPIKNYRKGERGAVLVVSLIMLAVMTLLVITMIRTAVLDLKIGGASQQAALNLANAEVAINRYLAGSPRFFLGCLLVPAPNGCSGGLGTVDLTGSRVVVTASQIGCVPGGARGGGGQIGGPPTVLFDARAGSTGMFGTVTGFGATAIHQGISSPAPVGTC